jgi:hypothetical protein
MHYSVLLAEFFSLFLFDIYAQLRAGEGVIKCIAAAFMTHLERRTPLFSLLFHILYEIFVFGCIIYCTPQNSGVNGEANAY